MVCNEIKPALFRMEFRCRPKQMIVLELSSCTYLKFVSFELKLITKSIDFVSFYLLIKFRQNHDLFQDNFLHRRLWLQLRPFLSPICLFWTLSSLPQGPIAGNFLSGHITKAWSSRHLQFSHFAKHSKDFDSFDFENRADSESCMPPSSSIHALFTCSSNRAL